MVFMQIVILLACYLAYRIFSSFIATRRIRAIAKQNHCEEPLDVAPSFRDGWPRLRRIMNAEKTGEDFLDDIIGEDFESVSTVQWSAFDGTKMISTIEPANLQAILATQFKDFQVGSRRYDTFKPVLGRSIFSSDGVFWEHSRALFRPQFARENINDLEMTDAATTSLITAIGPTRSEGWTNDTEMMPLIYNFTLDTATDFLFGESIDSQAAAMAAKQHSEQGFEVDPDKAARQALALDFKKSFGIMNEYMVKRLRLQSFWWLGDGLEFRKAINKVRRFTGYYTQFACDMAAAPEKSRGKKDSFVNALATQTQNRTEMRNQSLAVLLAGRDTTAAMLGWAIVCLALHPEVFDKLRSIVVRDFRPGAEITFAKLKGCRYLQHFLNEVLRLHPTVPLNQRVAVKDTTIPVGGGADQRSPIAVRKGQLILFSVYLMQRRKDLWGQDALEFKPERWEQKIPAWQFLPFLGGPRICLGQQFALTEGSYVLVRLLQEFDAIEPVDRADMSRLRKGLGVTMWPRDEARVRFRKARA